MASMVPIESNGGFPARAEAFKPPKLPTALCDGVEQHVCMVGRQERERVFHFAVLGRTK